MTDDDRFDMWLKDQARDYNAPPQTPKEEMWARIEAARRSDGPPVRRSVWWPLAAAAVLVIGIGIGWLLKPGTGTKTGGDTIVTTMPQPSGGITAFQVAATQFLGQTEMFLTAFRTEAAHGSVENGTSRRARELLSTTRLMMDSPAATDARLRMLLQELELVLAEISTLTGDQAGQEADMITEGLDQRGLLPRLRTAVPAGSVAAGS